MLARVPSRSPYQIMVRSLTPACPGVALPRADRFAVMASRDVAFVIHGAILRSMNVAIRKRPITRQEFLSWAQAQGGRYEFDGIQPVAMTGGTIRHSQITQNIHYALRTRLRGGSCRPLGPDAGLATIGQAVRYPDALVTCTKLPDTDYLVQGVVAVFEVLSPTSGQTDRIEKVREYRAVQSIRRYVIVEHNSIGVTVFERANADESWTATTLTLGDILRMPEIGIEIPVSELYESVDVSAAQGEASISA